MIPNESKCRVGRRRGVAMIVAIGVLAVLTIIVTALAASLSADRQSRSRGDAERQARVLARVGFDAAWEIFASEPGGLTGEMPIQLDRGAFVHVVSRIPAPEDAVYDGNFLKPRPGDVVLVVTASNGPRANAMRIEQTYLVNADPLHARRIMLAQKIGSASVSATAGDAPKPKPSGS